MTEINNQPRVIDIRPFGDRLADERTQRLVKTDQFEIKRLILAKGQVLAEHKAPGPIIVQCLEGHMTFHSMGKSHELAAGQLIFLPGGVLHSVTAHQASSFLLIIVSTTA